MGLVYEVMGFTWRAKSSKQQDAILIDNKVFQADLGITDLYQYSEFDTWCVAVADGVSSSPRSEKASVTVLDSVRDQWKEHPDSDISFNEIQQRLCQNLADNPKTTGASSTLALVKSTSPKGHLRIQHLGDSRVYAYNSTNSRWQCLTTDHNQLEELRNSETLDKNKEYASMYNALTGYFCADWLHEVFNGFGQEFLLAPFDALLVCTDGVHDVLACEYWPVFDKKITHKKWLTGIKRLLVQQGAYDNVSICLLRFNYYQE